MPIEQELRFYFPLSQKEHWLNLITKTFNTSPTTYFLQTFMYDNPNPKFTFYSKEVDGRFRLRKFENLTDPSKSYAVISWKQRIPEKARKAANTGASNESINTEYELEVNFDINEFDSLKKLIENILQMPYKSGYELYRIKWLVKVEESSDAKDNQSDSRAQETQAPQNIQAKSQVEITLNHYPYGLALELELVKGSDANALIKIAKMLNLDPKNSSNLSTDDMYEKLCKEKGITPKNEIMFDDKEMPKL